jgi:hypothetical protein
MEMWYVRRKRNNVLSDLRKEQSKEKEVNKRLILSREGRHTPSIFSKLLTEIDFLIITLLP